MELYVGMAVSLKETSICVVDKTGALVVEAVVASNVEEIAQFLRLKARRAVRIGMETGPTTTWLWHELRVRNFPVICIDARHAKAALSMQINKSDRDDAYGVARIMHAGWYREVEVKSLESHAVRALLNSRAMLVKIKRDLENQIRGVLKNFGLMVRSSKGKPFAERVAELIAEHAALAEVVEPLLSVRGRVELELNTLERKVRALAREDGLNRRFMTVPGVGPITALAFRVTIDDPKRFKRSRSVGAYVGLTPRRYASGEIDWTGRISKCGDGMLRTDLFEAAGVLLTRVQRWCTLKAWGLRVAARAGGKKARVAVARKLAVTLHRMWIDQTDFCWSTKELKA